MLFTKIILALAMLATLPSGAQSLSNTVTASAGSAFSSGSGSISFTVGEMAVVETFQNGYILSQGFQQPFSNIVTSVITPGFPGLSIKFFPNPCRGAIELSAKTDFPVTISGSMYDATGKLLYHFSGILVTNSQTIPFDWKNLSNGVYMLWMEVRKPGGTYSSRVLQKIIIAH